MAELLAVVLTGLLGFSSADYTLARAKVSDPLRAVVAAVFAVLVVLVAGALALVDVVDL